MEEIVLKRPASITSAEALDEIAEAYPDSEVLSFRRIKEAATAAELFVARIRVAAIDEDSIIDSDEVVVEDKEHEQREEKTMNKIVELLTDVLSELKDESDSAEKGMEDMQLEMEEMPISDEQDTIPEPDDLENKYQNIPPKVRPAQSMGLLSSYVLAREASVPKAIAKIELLREVSDKGHKIQSIKKIDNRYYATVVVTAEGEELSPEKKLYGPYVNPEARFPKFRIENPWVGNAEAKEKVIKEIMNNGENVTYEMARESLPLKEDMERWLLWRELQLQKSGFGKEEEIDILDEEYETLKKLPGGFDQRKNWYAGRDESFSGEKDYEQEERPGRRGPSLPEYMRDKSEEDKSDYFAVKQRLDLLKGETPEREEDFVDRESIDWSDENAIDWSGISSVVPPLPSEKKKKKKGEKPSQTSLRMSPLEMMKSMYAVAFDKNYPETRYGEREKTLTAQINLKTKEMKKAEKGDDPSAVRKIKAELVLLQTELDRLLSAKDQLEILLDENRGRNQEAFIRAYEEIHRVDPENSDPAKQAAWLRKSPYWEGSASIYKRTPDTGGAGQKSKTDLESQTEIFKSRDPFGTRRDIMERYKRQVPRPQTVTEEPEAQKALTKEEIKQQRIQQLQEQSRAAELEDMREEFGIPPGKKWQPTKQQRQEWERRIQEASA